MHIFLPFNVSKLTKFSHSIPEVFISTVNRGAEGKM